MTRSSTMPRVCALASALLIAVAGSGNAEVLRVPGDYGTVEAALNAAVSGDSVLVGPGTYSEIGLLSIGSGVTLLGDGPREDIWIYVFEGITLEEGPEPVRMEGLSFRVDTETRPDVIWARNDDCAIESNVVVDEYFHGDIGRLLWGIGGGVVRDNWFESGRLYGVILDPGGTWVLQGNTLAPTCQLALDNRPGTQFLSSAAIESLLLDHNTILGGADIYATHLEISNNIFADYSLFACPPNAASLSVHHNLFTSPTPHCPEAMDITNLVGVDPDFCSVEECDYRVSPASPAVGAGEQGEAIGAWPVGCAVADVADTDNYELSELRAPFPNPSSGKVHIRVAPNAERMRIFDVSGRQVAVVPLDNVQPVATWDRHDAKGAHANSGTYYMEIVMNDGSSIVQRVVLE